eukprot:scaffold16463_cov152-Skeletonema_marinoi.AAC.4
MLLGSSEENQTFAFFDSEDTTEEGGYQYTSMPTPGQQNLYVEPKPLEVKLAEQNEEGEDFFLEGEDDGAVIFVKVVDIHVQLSNESLATIGVPPFKEGESVLERLDTCVGYYFGELAKEGADLTQGILHYNNSCGEALVSLGRVDRDYGPKSTEEAMINFVDSLMLNKDIKSFIDADQWIKNFAAYAVTLNQDSIIDLVNNLYLGTVDNGGSWSIVQYDHNSIASRAVRAFCGSECQHRMIYHPILRPSCKSVEDPFILGRVLNDEKSWETYLKYVEEFVGVVESSIAGDLRSYGHIIKMYVVDDAFAKDQTVESYEESELGLDYSDYNSESNPLLKTLSARLDE